MEFTLIGSVLLLLFKLVMWLVAILVPIYFM